MSEPTETPPFKPQTVVVPLDFSDASSAALEAARTFVESDAQLRLVHVLPPLDSVSPGAVWGGLTDESREAAVREHAGKFLAAKNVLSASFDIRHGQPAHEVCEFADEYEADLIVISSHGYHGLKRFLLGSTAEQILRRAHCHVLVLRRADAE